MPKETGAEREDAGKWNGYQRPANLSPTDSRFTEIADLYYKELTKLYGNQISTRWILSMRVEMMLP